jgi:hypothetical protein
MDAFGMATVVIFLSCRGREPNFGFRKSKSTVAATAATRLICSRVVGVF